MFGIPSMIPTLRDFLTPKRDSLRKRAPEPPTVSREKVPREETWEDETPLPKITRDEVRGFRERR